MYICTYKYWYWNVLQQKNQNILFSLISKSSITKQDLATTMVTLHANKALTYIHPGWTPYMQEHFDWVLSWPSIHYMKNFSAPDLTMYNWDDTDNDDDTDDDDDNYNNDNKNDSDNPPTKKQKQYVPRFVSKQRAIIFYDCTKPNHHLKYEFLIHALEPELFTPGFMAQIIAKMAATGVPQEQKLDGLYLLLQKLAPFMHT